MKDVKQVLQEVTDQVTRLTQEQIHWKEDRAKERQRGYNMCAANTLVQMARNIFKGSRIVYTSAATANSEC